MSCGHPARLLKGIIDWLMTPSLGPKVLWLHGAAGLMKSTLANTVTECLRGYVRFTHILVDTSATPRRRYDLVKSEKMGITIASLLLAYICASFENFALDVLTDTRLTPRKGAFDYYSTIYPLRLSIQT